MNKIPMRQCIVTKERYQKIELLRVVKTPEGNIVVDDSDKKKMNGRGCYIKKDIAVIEEARKKGILNKEFEQVVPDDIYDQLVELANDKTK